MVCCCPHVIHVSSSSISLCPCNCQLGRWLGLHSMEVAAGGVSCHNLCRHRLSGFCHECQLEAAGLDAPEDGPNQQGARHDHTRSRRWKGAWVQIRINGGNMSEVMHFYLLPTYCEFNYYCLSIGTAGDHQQGACSHNNWPASWKGAPEAQATLLSVSLLVIPFFTSNSRCFSQLILSALPFVPIPARRPAWMPCWSDSTTSSSVSPIPRLQAMTLTKMTPQLVSCPHLSITDSGCQKCVHPGSLSLYWIVYANDLCTVSLSARHLVSGKFIV